MSVCALIVAGGRGSRARSKAHVQTPKQYAQIGGQTVLAHTMRAFLAHPKVDRVLVVIHTDDAKAYARTVAEDLSDTENPTAQLLKPVTGGANRQASVRAGLEALVPLDPQTVLIHDAARPFVDQATISNVLAKLKQNDGAVSAIPLSDTLKQSNDDQMIVKTVPRENLWRAQTPQGFRFSAILAAHRKANSSANTGFTDDAAIAEWAGLNVALVKGAPANEKLTTLEDLEMADEQLKAQQQQRNGPPAQQMNETRIGTGFDVHAFGRGDHVWLCGVKIPHDKTLIGHSDADVGLHALTDAILGALGEGDIGDHFPPSDPKWKGARSNVFLKHAAQLATSRHAEIINVDVTLICETPKIGPNRPAMRAAVSNILDIDATRVSVKATTSEQLGFTGRGEGIAALASASIRLPA